MANLTLELDENPDPTDVRRLFDGVRAFNQSQTGCDRPRTVAYFLRDGKGEVAGGVQGNIWGRSIHIGVLWIDEKYRGRGEGSRLMLAIEDYAVANGRPLIYLETTSFQALPFYESLGYRVFGQLPEISQGHTLFFLAKDVNRSPSDGDEDNLPSRTTQSDVI